jgi:hypothetical protein
MLVEMKNAELIQLVQVPDVQRQTKGLQGAWHYIRAGRKASQIVIRYLNKGISAEFLDFIITIYNAYTIHYIYNMLI